MDGIVTTVEDGVYVVHEGAGEGEFRVTEVVVTYSRKIAQPGGYDNAYASMTVRIEVGAGAEVDDVARFAWGYARGEVKKVLRPVVDRWYRLKGEGGNSDE